MEWVDENDMKICALIVKEKGGTAMFLQQRWGVEVFRDGLREFCRKDWYCQKTLNYVRYCTGR